MLRSPVENWALLRLAGIGGAVAAVVVAAPGRAATLESWQFDPNTHQLVITVPKGVMPNHYLVAEPARIVVDLPNTEVGIVPTQQSYTGAVRAVRVAQFQAGLARIVLELSPGAVLAPGQVELRQLESPDGVTDRWAVQPLFVTDSPVASSPVVDNPADSTATALPQPTISESAPSPADTPSNPANLADSEAASSEAVSSETADSSDATELAASSSETNPNETAANPEVLPPLEPGAVEIPIEPPTTANDMAAEDGTTEEPKSPEPAVAAGSPDPDVASVAEGDAAAAADEPEVSRTEATSPEATSPEATSPEVSSPAAATPAVIATQPQAEPSAVAPPEQAAVSSPTVTPSPIPASPSPATTAVSQPLPVDFSTPPGSLPDPNTPNGTAAALSLPAGSSAILTPTPARTVPSPTSATGSLSFPIPTAEGVSVPSIDSINPVETSATRDNPTASSQRREEPDATPTVASERSAPRNDSPPNASPRPLPAQTAAVPSTTSAAVPVEVPFGQPITGQEAPAADPAAIRFGQPIPTLQPSAVAKPEIEIIPFGQPLPFQSNVSN